MKVCNQCGASNNDEAQTCNTCGAPPRINASKCKEGNGALSAIKTCFRKYAVFEGRASRPEYWYFMLFSWLTLFADHFLFTLLRIEEIHGSIALYICLGVYLGIPLVLFLPILSVTVRRLHDTGKNGGYAILCLMPIVGWLAALFILICMLMRSEKCGNEYGPYTP